MNHNSTMFGTKIKSKMMLLFVAVAFVVKAFLPSGFMPVVNKDGFTQIVICSGMGEKTITVPSDDMPSQDHQNAPSDKVCAYQILASAKLLFTPPALTIPAPSILRDDFVSPDETTHVTFVTLSFDARGPPVV